MITVPVKALLAAMQPLVKFVEKNTAPVLKCVWVEVVEGVMTLRTTDLIAHVVVTLACDNPEATPMRVCLPGKAFHDLLKGFPKKAALSFTFDAATFLVSVTCNGETVPLAGISPSEFPLLPSPQWTEFISTGVEDFKAATKFVGSAAAGRKDARPNLQNIGFHSRWQDTFCTDAYRLHVTSMPWTTQPDPNLPFHVVTMPYALLAKVLPALAPKSLVSLSHSPLFPDTYWVYSNSVRSLSVYSDYVRLTSDNLTVLFHQTGGGFPDYKAITQRDNVTDCLLVPTQDLLSAAEKLLATHPDRSAPKVRLEVHGSTLTVSHGTASFSLPVEDQGLSLFVDLNAHYVVDLLETLGHSTVALVFKEVAPNQNPVRFESPLSSGHVALVMPMGGR